MKRLLGLLFFALFIATSGSKTFAVDLTVTCDGISCSMSPSSGSALFTELNWLPGDTVTKTLTVNNTSSQDACFLTLDLTPQSQVPADFASKLFTNINNGVVDLYGSLADSTHASSAKSLNDLYGAPLLDMGFVGPSSSRVYNWTTTFDPASGNPYQLASTVFDFDMNFACGENSTDCTEGSTWAFAVVSASQGTLNNGGAVTDPARTNPSKAVGPADWVPGTGTNFFSLGKNGTITLSFQYPVLDVDGSDLSFHEATNGRPTYPEERVEVFVSQDGTNFESIGFAGSEPGGSGDGVVLLDFSGTGFEWIKYVRLVESTNWALQDPTADGYDLDAVDAVFGVCRDITLPELKISKSVDQFGVDQATGDVVTYRLTVSSFDANVNDVLLTDLPPDDFVYEPGSWTAISNLRGNLVGLGVTTEPTYHSPGDWVLGDMKAGEVVELSYKAKIGSSVTPGLYKDVAYARGVSDFSDEVIANDDTGVFVFVGTQIAVVSDEAEVDKVEVERKEIKKDGEVLGVATSLPAAGSSVFLIYVAAGMFVLGVALMMTGLAKSFRKTLGILLFLCLFALLRNAYAAPDLIIRLSEPEDTNSNSVALSFVTLDLKNRPVTVKCFVKKAADLAFSQFGPDINTLAGGDSGSCPAQPIFSAEGKYEFFVTAKADAEEAVSDTVSFEYETNGPGKPTDYKKDKTSDCQYKITFKTADDNGETEKVEIYRSDKREFETSIGNRIKTIVVGSSTSKDFSDDVPTCGKSYYYALRAYDGSGNASSIVGDKSETVEVSGSSSTSQTTKTETTSGVQAAAIPLGSGVKSAVPEPEVVIDQNGVEVQPDVLGESTASDFADLGAEKDIFGGKSTFSVIGYLGLGIIGVVLTGLIAYKFLKKIN